jgi:hypothetical protein
MEWWDGDGAAQVLVYWPMNTTAWACSRSRGEELDVSVSGPLMPSKADLRADVPGGRVRANSGLIRRNKIDAYSITS